jgi:hypothetical protein
VGAARSRTRLRAIALPVEHGSWGLVSEPVLLGLLVAPSWGGLSLTIGVVAAFLTRRPGSVLRVEWRHTASRRRAISARFFAAYGAIAVAGLAAAIWISGPALLAPLTAALPFLVVFLVYDISRQNRSWQAEVAGPTGFAAVAASVAMAAGWPLAEALALSAVVIARAVPAVLYIRARLRLDRDTPSSIPLVIGAHVLAALCIAALVAAQLLPGLVVVAFLILLARAAVGLSTLRARARASTIGFIEVGFGALTILSVVIGFW